MNRPVPRRPRRRLAVALGAVLLAAPLAACSGGDDASSASDQQLVGLFRLDAGKVSGGKVTGTWFKMVQIGGTPAKGPYMVNGDSKADGGQTTLLAPGTSGGFRSAGYQSQPRPAFAASGDSRAAAITRPTGFFGVRFSISTNAVDPQTRTSVAPPTVRLVDGRLQADLSSWAASWNNQDFNQGAPKPVSSTDAKAPGQAKAEKVWDWVSGTYLEASAPADVTGEPATGTYDPKTKRFTLEWTSRISGGPFNNFTGLWHLEGTFEPDAAAPKDAAKDAG